MTYDKKQQEHHRKAFIEECRQKAWGAACHSDWISKSIDELIAHYQKLQDEDRTLEADIKASDQAVDYHTVENRQKRKAMQERRHQLAQDMKVLGESAHKGQQAMQQLLQSVESGLQLADHAEKWEWKEVEVKPTSDSEPK